MMHSGKWLSTRKKCRGGGRGSITHLSGTINEIKIVYLEILREGEFVKETTCNQIPMKCRLNAANSHGIRGKDTQVGVWMHWTYTYIILP